MKPEGMMKKLEQLEKNVLKSKTDDSKTKYQVVSMFRYIKKLIQYQVPMPPVNVSEDGHHFECARCGTKFDSEDHVDDFSGCYICLQRWKEGAEDESLQTL